MHGDTNTHLHRTSKRRGRVSIYVRDGIKYKVRYDLSIFKEGQFGSIFIEVDGLKHERNTIIGEIYRLPGTKYDDFLFDFETVLDTINCEKMNVIIGTDQNIDYLQINTHAKTQELLDLSLEKGTVPCITKLTRITITSSTLITHTPILSFSHTFLPRSACVGGPRPPLPEILDLPLTQESKPC